MRSRCETAKSTRRRASPGRRAGAHTLVAPLGLDRLAAHKHAALHHAAAGRARGVESEFNSRHLRRQARHGKKRGTERLNQWGYEQGVWGTRRYQKPAAAGAARKEGASQ